MPPDNDATEIVRIHRFPNLPGNGLHAKPFCTRGTKRPRRPLWGVAERSESFKIMIAGGNHTTVERWLSVSETGGVCSSTERCKITPQSARSGCQLPQRGRRGRFAPQVMREPASARHRTGRALGTNALVQISQHHQKGGSGVYRYRPEVAIVDSAYRAGLLMRSRV